MTLKVRQKVYLLHNNKVIETEVSSVETKQTATTEGPKRKPVVSTEVRYRACVGRDGWPTFTEDQLFTSKEALLASL